MSSPPAIVLHSGGLDSSTCLAIALDQGFAPVALSFEYGQRHDVEVAASKRVLAHYHLTRHLVFEIDLFSRLGGNALTGDVDVPRQRNVEDMASDIPATFVPARNLVFLAYALSVAESVGADDIFIGVNALDYSGYPDCRPEFVEQFERTANLATRPGHARPLRIHAPLVHLSKAQIIQWGVDLGVPYHLTHSCYAPAADGRSCGECDSCLLRLDGFAKAGIPDPIPYVGASLARAG